MIIIEIIISDDNNDNHNTGQAFRTYISIEITYQVISSLIFQVPGTQSLHFNCRALATLISKVPVRHVELTYQVLSYLIFEAPGTQSLHFKCPALTILIFKVPGFSIYLSSARHLQPEFLEVPGIQNLSFKCPAAGHKVVQKNIFGAPKVHKLQKAIS